MSNKPLRKTTGTVPVTFFKEKKQWYRDFICVKFRNKGSDSRRFPNPDTSGLGSEPGRSKGNGILIDPDLSALAKHKKRRAKKLLHRLYTLPASLLPVLINKRESKKITRNN